jgi:hypothetical protein
MSLDSWLKRKRQQQLDLDSGELVSLNLVDRPKPSTSSVLAGWSTSSNATVVKNPFLEPIP